jgi:hypothetical protein
VAHPLDDARAKLDRARQHFTNLKRQATKLGRDPDRHRILVDYDPDEGRYVVYSKLSPDPLPNLSLVLGDLIHNARGALDFTTWQLAIKHLRREPTEEEAKSIQFPITDTKTRFDGSRVLPFVSKDVAKEMLRHQPHPGSKADNDHLAVLHWISNRDKHRLVVPLFPYINPPPFIPKYVFEPLPPRGTVFAASPLGAPRRGDVSFKGDPTTTKLGWVKLTPRPANAKIYVDPQPPLEVLFRGPADYLSVADIKALLDHVKRVVGCFNRFL